MTATRSGLGFDLHPLVDGRPRAYLAVSAPAPPDVDVLDLLKRTTPLTVGDSVAAALADRGDPEGRLGDDVAAHVRGLVADRDRVHLQDHVADVNARQRCGRAGVNGLHRKCLDRSIVCGTASYWARVRAFWCWKSWNMPANEGPSSTPRSLGSALVSTPIR